MSDTTIDQDTRILIQKLLAGAAKDDSKLQVITIGQVQIGGGQNLGVLGVLDTLTPPRWESLIKEMVRATVDHFDGSQRKAAAYLNVPEKRISYWMLEKLNKRGDQLEVVDDG